MQSIRCHKHEKSTTFCGPRTHTVSLTGCEVLMMRAFRDSRTVSILTPGLRQAWAEASRARDLLLIRP